MTTKPAYAVRYRDSLEKDWRFYKTYEKKKDAVEAAKRITYYRTQVVRVIWDNDIQAYRLDD